MKWIEINKRGNRTILNVDKIIKITTYKDNEQYGFDIHYKSGQTKERINLNFINEDHRNSEYDRLLDFLICSDNEVTCIWLINN